MKFDTLKKVAVTMKIKSRSPKSNQLFTPSQHCICASLVLICITKILSTLHTLPTLYLFKFGLNLSTGSEDNAQTKFHTLKKVAVTLKIGLRSPKSNQLVPPSHQCICASLVKIHPSVQKIMHGNEATRTQTPTGSAPKTICPPPFSWGDISISF